MHLVHFMLPRHLDIFIMWYNAQILYSDVPVKVELILSIYDTQRIDPSQQPHSPQNRRPWTVFSTVRLPTVGGCVFYRTRSSCCKASTWGRLGLAWGWPCKPPGSWNSPCPLPFLRLMASFYLQLYVWYCSGVWETTSGGGFLEGLHDIHQTLEWMEGAIPQRMRQDEPRSKPLWKVHPLPASSRLLLLPSGMGGCMLRWGWGVVLKELVPSSRRLS